MSMYHYITSQPPPTLPPLHPSYLGSPHHSLNPYYHQGSIAPYPLPNEYMTTQQVYLPPPPSTIHSIPPPPQPVFVTGAYPCNHPIYDEEPSCFISFLENFCCCFGFGVPQNHYEALVKHEMQRRRLIAKEEKNRIRQYQKTQQEQQEKQRLAAQVVQQQSSTTINNTAAAATNKSNNNNTTTDQ